MYYSVSFEAETEVEMVDAAKDLVGTKSDDFFFSMELLDVQLLLVVLGLNYCQNRTQHILSHNCHTCLGYWKSMKNREMTSFMFAETARVIGQVVQFASQKSKFVQIP